uniref:Kazrin n=1 Tax=Sus scrofa TaxID=9823 RepID=A0A8D1ADL5_PIG
MMEDNKQLALRIDGAVQSASQEVTNLRAELTATNRRLAELSGGGGGGPGPGPGAAASASAAADSAANMENHQHSAQGRDRPAPGAEERPANGGFPGSCCLKGLFAVKRRRKKDC